MGKIQVIYFSQTGNTEEMAQAVGKGITDAGKEAEVIEVSDASIEALKESASFALGCPATGTEVIDEDEMEPLVAQVEAFASGKNIALFGSYGWGEGQWMKDWADRMKNAGANIVNGEGLICQETPDNDTIKQCEKLGSQLAQL